MKIKFSSYRVHNYLGHPAMQLFEDLASLSKKISTPVAIVHALTGFDLTNYLEFLSQKAHNSTLPSKKP